jgi:outer membrane protein OmpA-like peptidoglycan-associated protein
VPISASGGDSSDDDLVATTDDELEGVSDVDTTISTSAVPSTSLSAGGSTVPPGDGSGATAASASTSVPPAAGGTPLGYPTSPDGAPLPLVVVFDTETITISGQVPSQAAKDRLAALAKANSQFPDAEVIDNMVVNPAVPISVGARVIELNSARFPESTADILPDHALELDRVVNIMNALPNISVLVIGHADQRGDDLSNFAISDERARAVVNYLIFLGISPARLASRAAGAVDLLTLGDDNASLALNRRTEFIFGGLLIE